MLNKLKQWISKAGVSNLGWIAVAGISALFGWCIIASGALGIFLYLNWNIIRKLL